MVDLFSELPTLFVDENVSYSSTVYLNVVFQMDGRMSFKTFVSLCPVTRGHSSFLISTDETFTACPPVRSRSHNVRHKRVAIPATKFPSVSLESSCCARDPSHSAAMQ
jgi:hypothetical protein